MAVVHPRRVVATSRRYGPAIKEELNVPNTCEQSERRSDVPAGIRWISRRKESGTAGCN